MASKITERELAETIKRYRKTGQATHTVLQTDERVLARVTDGIYRQPASALRELIANAYDADARTVIIHSDPPRFSRISIWDDGWGMDEEQLSHLIHHIGGSAKRTRDGADLRIVNADDPTRSPLGRKLIGKIGIGLFSVSQLTKQFQIITKRAGDDYRLVADVKLNTYREDELGEAKSEKLTSSTGEVSIWSVPAEDRDSSGTEVILRNLLPAARDMLQSRDTWERVSARDDVESEYFGEQYEPPKYHIGRTVGASASVLKYSESLPWGPDDDPVERFRNLYRAVVDEVASSTAKPRLSATIDRYLETIWTLSLSAPLDYLEEHPFDVPDTSGFRAFYLSNSSRKAPEEIDLHKGSPRSQYGLKAPLRGDGPPFKVLFDGLELRRPVSFSNLPGADVSNPARRPLLFFGHLESNLEKLPPDKSGGKSLKFEAYFLWTPIVVPIEHKGVLIRIGDASGTLYDSTFLHYQVSELTRLSQITGEIFVHEGLDAALNIDRESFNFGHPHAKMVMAWVHRALRQITNTHKKITKEARETARHDNFKHYESDLRHFITDFIQSSDAEILRTPAVEFSDEPESRLRARRSEGIVALRQSAITENMGSRARRSQALRFREEQFRRQVEAALQGLHALGVLGDADYRTQEKIAELLTRIFWDPKA